MLHRLDPEKEAACCGESKGSAARMALQTELRARAVPARRRSRSWAKERREEGSPVTRQHKDLLAGELWGRET